jgi:hypothetical protein
MRLHHSRPRQFQGKPPGYVPPINEMLRELMDRYPLMFVPLSAMDMTAGWYAVFENLCDDIDFLQEQQDLGFCWLALDEQFGRPCWNWAIRLFQPQGEALQVLDQIKNQVEAAKKECLGRCMVCATPASLFQVKGWLSTTCTKHLLLLEQDPDEFVRLADIKPDFEEEA